MVKPRPARACSCKTAAVTSLIQKKCLFAATFSTAATTFGGTWSKHAHGVREAFARHSFWLVPRTPSSAGMIGASFSFNSRHG